MNLQLMEARDCFTEPEGRLLYPKVANRKLKIAVSIPSFKPNTGGLQAHAEQLCQNLLGRGHHVTVIARTATREPQGRDYLFFNEPNPNLVVSGVPVTALTFSRYWVPALWFLGKCVVRSRFEGLAVNIYERVSETAARRAYAGMDIIHHVGEAPPLSGFAAAVAAKHWRIPFIVQPTCHPYVVGDSPLDLRLCARADRILAHTKYEANYLRQKFPECPIDVVGNGISPRADGIPDRFRAKSGVTGPFILFIGRKDSQKGYHLLIEAFKIICRKRPDLSLVCMGPTQSAMTQSKMDGVIDLSFVSEDEKHDALAACDCLCVPSEGESFGLVFIEAGLYAKPVIGRDVAVLRELWSDGKAGLMVGKADNRWNRATLSPEELAAATLRLLSDPQECRRLGENLRKISERFVWPVIVERFEDSYYHALERFEKQRPHQQKKP
jgi:glycosyltransferase involved in cell wall biosynthesis